jgi:hypothetical protein
MRKGRSAPVLDRALPPAGDVRSPLEARILLVGGQLDAMDGELLRCQAAARGRWRQLGEEELQEAQAAQLRRLRVSRPR